MTRAIASHRAVVAALVSCAMLLVSLPLGENAPAGVLPRTEGARAAPTASAFATAGIPSPTPATSGLTPKGPSAGGSATLLSGACANGSNSGVQQAYDPATNDLYEAWNGCGGIGVARSLDGGATFSNASRLAACGSDPSLAVAPNGSVFLSYRSNCTGGPSPYVLRSSDHGTSWSAATRVLPTGTVGLVLRDRLAITANGTVELVWIDSANASLDRSVCPPMVDCYYTHGDFDALLSRSFDGGRTWTPASSVNSLRATMATLSASIVVAPSGSTDLLLEEASVSGSSDQLGAGGFYFTQAPAAGFAFAPARLLTTDAPPAASGWPDGSISADRSGTLYAAFDSTVGTDTALLSVSRDSGTTWGNPLPLSQAPNLSARALVTVSGGGVGIAHVAWLSNSSRSGTWALEGATVWGNGTNGSGPAALSNATGALGGMAGTELSLLNLGRGWTAAAWSINVSGPPPVSGPSLQAFATVTRDPLPAAPSIAHLTPGAGTVLVRWNGASGNAPVAGYTLGWGPEMPGWQSSVGPTTFNGSATGLSPSTHYVVSVRAFNDAGNGTPSALVRFTLTAWAIVTGRVSPSTAGVTLDGAPVSVASGVYRANTSVGAHLLSATATGYQPLPRAFSTPWNGTIFENLSLARDSGSVSGFIVPWNATAAWDGSRIPIKADGSYTESGVAGTVHRLSASAPGYFAASLDVTVPDRSIGWANLSLAPMYGALVLSVLPHSAVVTVNATSFHLNQSGGIRLSLPPGTYRVLARATGYTDGLNVTSVVAGAVDRVAFNLTLAPPNPTSSPANVRALEEYGGVAGIALVLAIVGLWSYRRRLPPPGPPQRPPGSEPLYGEEPRPGPEAYLELPRGETPIEDGAGPPVPPG